MRNLLAAVVTIAGAVLIISGIVLDIKLQWIDHPEATHRLLWIEHTGTMCGIFASGFFGFLMLTLGPLFWKWK